MRSGFPVPAFRVFCSSVPCFLFQCSTFRVFCSGVPGFLFQRSTFRVFCSGVPGFLFQRSTFRRSTFRVLVLPPSQPQRYTYPVSIYFLKSTEACHMYSSTTCHISNGDSCHMVPSPYISDHWLLDSNKMKMAKGPFTKYVALFLPIFDTPYPL